MSWIDAYRRDGRLEGRCLCGAVTLTIDGGHVAAVGVCHCVMCRRWSGALHASFEATASAVTVVGPVVRYPSTEFSERAFCGTCGSHLWMRNNEPDADFELMPGPFAAANEFPLVSEIYVDRRPAFLPLTGDHRTATRAVYEQNNPNIEGDDP